MIFYIILASALFILFYLRNTSLYSNVISKDYICVCSVLVLFIIYVFRNISVGTDYLMYHLFFYLPPDELKKGFFVETGYVHLNQIAQNHNTFIIIPIIAFIIIYFGFYFLIREFHINRFTFLFIFVVTYIYLFSFDVLRQFIALGIVCIGLGLLFYFDKYNSKILKYILFIIIIFISSFFHSSSVFCLIFLCLPYLKIRSKEVFISGLFTSIFYFNNYISKLVNKILIYFPNYFQKYGSMGNKTFSKNFVTFIPVIIQFIYLFAFVRNNKIVLLNKKIDKKYNFIISGYLLYLILFVTNQSLILQRLQIYTYIFPLMFTCELFNKTKLNELQLYISSLYKYSFVLFWIVFYILRLFINTSGVVPYSFI